MKKEDKEFLIDVAKVYNYKIEFDQNNKMVSIKPLNDNKMAYVSYKKGGVLVIKTEQGQLCNDVVTDEFISQIKEAKSFMKTLNKHKVNGNWDGCNIPVAQIFSLGYVVYGCAKCHTKFNHTNEGYPSFCPHCGSRVELPKTGLIPIIPEELKNISVIENKKILCEKIDVLNLEKYKSEK